MTHLIKILRQEIPQISESELEDFLQLWKVEKTISRHELLYSRGIVNTNIYFMLSGSIKICYYLGDKEIITGFGFTNRFIFDIYSFFSEKPTTAYFKAIKSCRLIGINKKDFLSFARLSACMNDFWEKQKEQIILRFAESHVENLS